MGQVKVTEPVRVTREITYVAKDPLYMSVCDGCNKRFLMEEWCNDGELATLTAPFDGTAERQGNMFTATCCSFICAHRIFDGGWKSMPQYDAFLQADRNLVRGSIKITTLVKGEKEAVAAWEESGPTCEISETGSTMWRNRRAPRWMQPSPEEARQRRVADLLCTAQESLDADALLDLSKKLKVIAGRLLAEESAEA